MRRVRYEGKDLAGNRLNRRGHDRTTDTVRPDVRAAFSKMGDWRAPKVPRVSIMVSDRVLDSIVSSLVVHRRCGHALFYDGPIAGGRRQRISLLFID